MKKFTSFMALALCTVSVFAFAGCGQKTTTEKKNAVESKSEEVASESVKAENEVESKEKEVAAESASVSNEAEAEAASESASESASK